MSDGARQWKHHHSIFAHGRRDGEVAGDGAHLLALRVQVRVVEHPPSCRGRDLRRPGATPPGLASYEDVSGVFGELAETFVEVGDLWSSRRAATNGASPWTWVMAPLSTSSTTARWSMSVSRSIGP
jgi:hypothetical protein